MSVKKNPRTGEIIEVETEKLDGITDEAAGTRPSRGRGSPRRAESPTIPDGDAQEPGRPRGTRASSFEAETQRVKTPGRRGQSSGEPKTRPYRPGSDPAPSRTETSSADDAMDDPTVGWLVVVDGPGKGQVRRLGYGVNSLGRGGKSRVKLDFGDGEISREDHATVAYDPKGRRYYIQHGGGMNLTYLDDEPVLAPTPLEALRHIVLGATTLRFVPLCGPDFDWQDLD